MVGMGCLVVFVAMDVKKFCECSGEGDDKDSVQICRVGGDGLSVPA